MSVCSSPTGQLHIITGAYEGEVCVWRVRDGKLIGVRQFTNHGATWDLASFPRQADSTWACVTASRTSRFWHLWRQHRDDDEVHTEPVPDPKQRGILSLFG